MAQKEVKSAAVEKWRLDPFTSIATYLDNSEEGKSLIGRAIRSLLINNADDYNKSDCRALAQQVIQENIATDINLYALFLIVWSVTSAKGLNLSESKMILKKLEDLDQQSLYPETQATILATVGYYKGVSGNKIIRFLYLQK